MERNRQEGFYWVKQYEDGPWLVMRWTGGAFWDTYKDVLFPHEVHSINEERIKSPNE